MEGDDGRGMRPEAPAKAVETACLTEQQRSTLSRALRTILFAVYARGFDIQFIGGHSMPPGCSPDHPATSVPLAEFQAASRCEGAAKDREVVVVGVVPDEGPRPGTPAAAHGLAPGTQTAVVCINTGDVKPVRDAVRSMRTKWPLVHTIIFISFLPLTPFTKKEITGIAHPRVQYFNVVEDLQHNALAHTLVQPHVVLDSVQAARARARFRGAPGEDTHFSVLGTSDPPVRLLGLHPGDLVHVTEQWGRAPPHDTIFVVRDL